MVHGNNQRNPLSSPFQIFDINCWEDVRFYPISSTSSVYPVAEMIKNRNVHANFGEPMKKKYLQISLDMLSFQLFCYCSSEDESTLVLEDFYSRPLLGYDPINN